MATRALARDDARSLGLFGAGVQARTQLLAIHAVRPLERVLVCDPLPEARERFAAEMSDRLALPVVPTDDARDTAEQDIVVTASSSKTPVFDGAWIRPGTHINGIGSHSPDARELDTEIVRRSRVVSDHAPARLAEDADFMVPIRDGAITPEHVHLELGDVLLGRQPGRRSRDEITLFKSGGLAVQDLVTGARVLQLARAAGIGCERLPAPKRIFLALSLSIPMERIGMTIVAPTYRPRNMTDRYDIDNGATHKSPLIFFVNYITIRFKSK